ncbi:MAG: hypothetical protein AAB768_03130 [Patescibacteria group bacterium]
MNNIIQISVNRIDGKSVDLNNKENRETIEKYVLPIIEKNVGWDTEFVEIESLWELDKKRLQNTIDATLGADDKCKCWIYLKEGEPVGLFQAREEMFNNKNIMSGYGIVLRSDLQGKKTGIADELYKLAEGHILFGWTSNPAIVAKHRKLGRTVFFPTNEYDEFSKELVQRSLEDWENDSWKKLKFGVAQSVYFNEKRGDEYLMLADRLLSEGKMTKSDNEGLKYIIGLGQAEGAIVTFPNE